MSDTASLIVRVSGSGIKSTERDLGNLTGAANSATNATNKLGSAFAGLSALVSAGSIVKYADAWTSVSNKLTNSTKASETLLDVQTRVLDIANAT